MPADSFIPPYITRALNEILSHHPNCINLKDSENGCTPLHCAILRGNHGIVAYLLKQVRAFNIAVL